MAAAAAAVAAAAVVVVAVVAVVAVAAAVAAVAVVAAVVVVAVAAAVAAAAVARNTPGQSGGLRCKAGVSLHLPLSYPRQVDSTFPTQDASAPCTRPLPAAHAMHRLLTPSGAPSDLVAALYQVNLRAQQEENCSAENNAL